MSIVRVFKILNIFPFSEKHLIDCDTGNKGCDGGSYTTAWKYLTNGSAKQSLYPYAPAVISQQNNKIDIKLFKISVCGHISIQKPTPKYNKHIAEHGAD